MIFDDQTVTVNLTSGTGNKKSPSTAGCSVLGPLTLDFVDCVCFRFHCLKRAAQRLARKSLPPYRYKSAITEPCHAGRGSRSPAGSAHPAVKSTERAG